MSDKATHVNKLAAIFNTNRMDTSIVTALIATGTSVLTIVIFKPIVDRRLLKFQLKQNHIAEQSKKVKQHIAEHKGKLLRAAENLNRRLKNYSKTYNEGWLSVNGNYSSDNHYMDTFVYRFLVFFAEIKLLEKDLIYIDTTIAQKSDLRMLKYFRLFHELMCDVDLFEGNEYNATYAKDHFFSGPFYNLSNSIIVNNSVIELDDYLNQKSNILSKINSVYVFFDNINPNEDRLRFERLKAFHLILIAFLNEYGYDFQKTPDKKYTELKTFNGDYKLVDNLEKLVEKYKLNKFCCGAIENVIKKIK